MITSPHNQHLKTIRRLRRTRERSRSGLLVAEGEDLVEAAVAAGFEPEVLLRAGVDVEPTLLADVSSLGSGTRVAGVFRQRWSQPGGDLSVYLHEVRDPGNVGTVIRCAHAFCDGPVVLGPDCADPWSPKAVRASMGSAFARPPARGRLEALEGTVVALDQRAEVELGELRFEPPVVLCLGAERAGLPDDDRAPASVRARIGMRPGGPESLNVAIAGAIALHQAAIRMAPRA